MRKLYFVLSIDTEEEWDWTGPFPSQTVSVDNVDHIPDFHQRMLAIGALPTYFVDYAVLENSHSHGILKQLYHSSPGIEFGAHLHPWVTPPKTRIDSEADSHIVNLPLEQVQQQLHNLTAAITELTQRAPTSFRSGRWGINDGILQLLADQGYLVDSSVYPYYQNDWFSCAENTSQPFRVTSTTPSLIELPVTAGFNRQDFSKANRLHNRLQQQPWASVHSIGLLWATNLLRKIYLSPELSGHQDMLQLCQQALANDYPIIHMYLHSSSLLPGSTEYVRTKREKEAMLKRIEIILDYLRQHREVEVLNITEAAQRLANEGGLA